MVLTLPRGLRGGQAEHAGTASGDERVMENKQFVEGIDLRAEGWSLDELRQRWQVASAIETDERWMWSFDPKVMRRFRHVPTGMPLPVAPTQVGEMAG